MKLHTLAVATVASSPIRRYNNWHEHNPIHFAEHFWLPAVSATASRGDRNRGRWWRRAGADADRRRQIALLSDTGAGSERLRYCNLAVDRADERPGGCAARAGCAGRFSKLQLHLAQIWDIERALRDGELDLLYMAPERLTQQYTLDLLHQIDISLFAIDEAHCVSQWGHDFRADYLQLSLLHTEFPQVPRIALTATADARTRSEIILRLALTEAAQYVAGFDRPNIRYSIALRQNPRNQLLGFLRDQHPADAGIVYCLSRKKTEETAAWLKQQGFNALPYHAGLDAAVRQTNQSRFLREEAVIIVATIAFGMGIDKPDVRFVAHLDLPRTIESYYQETGRAGRDGQPADAWMLYGLADVAKLRQMLDSSDGDEEYKRVEQVRLYSMLGLCEITTCRRHSLLNYFDEDSAEHCGNCDTCLFPVDTWDGTEAAQKALSTVYRTGQRFGVNHLIDVLRGNDTDKVRQFNHQSLTVFGVGADINAGQWRSVFRQLLARAYITVDVDRYGALCLQQKCWPLLRGQQTIELRRDTGSKPTKPARTTPTPPLENMDPVLWESLREQRRQLARQQGVPPYVIFHDSTLRAMTVLAPTSLEEFRRLPGVGASKLEKYGAVFLDVIAGAKQGATDG